MAWIIVGCTGPADQTTDESPSPNAADLSTLAPHERSVEYARRCFIEKGWDARIDPQTGGLVTDVPPDQQSAFQADAEECNAAYDKEFPAPELTEELAQQLYQQELATVECLAAQGYPSVQEPISEQAYVAALLSPTKDSPTWTAYSAVGAIGAEEFRELEEKCPQPSIDR